MKIVVDKYHGCGNDFIILPWENVQNWPEDKLEDFIVSVCDRHTGIGADGCIFVRQHPLEMIYYNQDGSRADMCGNGIRCFANYCFDHQVTGEGLYTVETLAGPQVVAELSQEPFRVQVDLGKPVFDNSRIQADPHKIAADTPLWNYLLEVSVPSDTGLQSVTIPVCSMYMGTIHTVVFVEDAFDPALEALGKAICEHPLFTRQTNVNFVQVLDDSHIKAATYERGCGMTLACGTGMCASAVACLRENKTGPHLQVQMKRGSLQIDLDKDGSVFLTGPAQHIMKGTFDYEYNES